MIKNVLLITLASSALAVLPTTAPAAADTGAVSVAAPAVHLPRSHAPAREVLATVTVDREVRWSATVFTRTYGGSDWAGRVLDVPVPAGQETLEPGVNRMVLGTTDVISDPGPQQVTVVTTDPATGTEVGRGTATLNVVGHLHKPRIRHTRTTGRHVILRGKMDSNVPDLRLAVIGRRLGAATNKRLAMVNIRPIDGRWRVRLSIRRPTRLRVKAKSAYGKPVSSRAVTVRRWPSG
jgi:hypothetical protein